MIKIYVDSKIWNKNQTSNSLILFFISIKCPCVNLTGLPSAICSIFDFYANSKGLLKVSKVNYES